MTYSVFDWWSRIPDSDTALCCIQATPKPAHQIFLSVKGTSPPSRPSVMALSATVFAKVCMPPRGAASTCCSQSAASRLEVKQLRCKLWRPRRHAVPKIRGEIASHQTRVVCKRPPRIADDRTLLTGITSTLQDKDGVDRSQFPRARSPPRN